MTYAQYETSFRKKALNAGFSEDNILRCLEYAKPLVENDFPVIFNTTNLCALVGYNKDYIKGAAIDPKFYYRSFKIKKSDNKFRFINEPLPSLKEIQLWILENILYRIKVSKFAKAYVRKRNIIDNVKYHIDKEKILSLDIKDFFPSLKRKTIEQIFYSLGYSSNISNLLSKLCCLHDSLPQGAPTSPCLSNIAMIEIDAYIANYCLERNVRYTRYADDLTFSGSFDDVDLKNFVMKQLTRLNMFLNEDKTRVMSRGQQQIVTGIIVNQKLQIPKEERKRIRLEMHYITLFGLSNHLERTKNTKANYLSHLQGKINYGLYINPDDKELLKYKALLKEFEAL